MGTFLLALLLIPKLHSDSRKYGFTPTLTMGKHILLAPQVATEDAIR